MVAGIGLTPKIGGILVFVTPLHRRKTEERHSTFAPEVAQPKFLLWRLCNLMFD